MKQFKIIFSIMMLLCILSCKKYLDTKPDSNVTTPSTIADLQALLDLSNTMNQKTPCYDEASADDYFFTLATYNTLSIKSQTAYLWQPYANDWTNDWANAYTVVYQANVCLDALNTIDRTSANGGNWDNVKGSALFFRANSFLKLAWTYAKAYDQSSASNDYGIVLRLGSDFNVKSVRASVQETYQRIINDIETAIPLLPSSPQHVMRPSKAAAYALLARTYLSMRQYDKAYQYSDLCLKIKNDLIDYNSIAVTSTSPFQSFNQEVIFHTDISAFGYSISATSARVDTLLYRSYNVSDLRQQAFFTTSAGYQQFKGSYAARTALARPLFTGIATDEVYLMRAECLARSGDKDKALIDLNKLMKMRWSNKISFQPIVAKDNVEALSIILNERRKELLFRGLRWMDIKRLNKEGYGIIIKRMLSGKEYSILPNTEKFALPLPNDVISITGIPQNSF